MLITDKWEECIDKRCIIIGKLLEMHLSYVRNVQTFEAFEKLIDQ